MPPRKETLKDGHKVSWVITGDGARQKIFKKTLPKDEAFVEWDDIIIEIIHDQREQVMIKLLKKYLEKNGGAKK